MLLAFAQGGRSDVNLLARECTWDKLCEIAAKPKIGEKDGSYLIRGGKLRNPRRADENLLEAELLVIDGDSSFDPETGEIFSGAPALPDVGALLVATNLTFLAHTSHSAEPESGFWKYRIFFPCRLKSAQELEDCVDYIHEMLRANGISLAEVPEEKRWSQPWYLPRVRDEKAKAHYMTLRHDGQPFPVEKALAWAEKRRQAEAAIKQQPAVEALKPRNEVQGGIQAFNDQNGLSYVRSLLEKRGYRFGYLDKKSGSYRYMRPGSETQTFGVMVFQGKMGHWCTYSHHGAADPLSGRVCDPFELTTALEFNGDRKAAARSLLKQESITEKIAARQSTPPSAKLEIQNFPEKLVSVRPSDTQKEANSEQSNVKDLTLGLGNSDLPELGNKTATQAPSAPPKRKVELIPWGALKDEPIRWLVKDVLPASSFAAIYGRPGSFKSFCALYLASMIASGRDAFGNATTQGACVYVAGEGGAGLKRRRDALLRQHDLPSDLPVHFVKAQLNLSTSLEDMEALFAAIRAASVAPSLIIFDTFARIFIGDENSAKDVGACIAILGAIQAEFNCCVCIVHHSAKSNDQAMRGSSALLGAVDTELHCEKISPEGAKDRIGQLTITKQKDGADDIRLGYRMDIIHLSDIDSDLTSLALVPVDKKELSATIERAAKRAKPKGVSGQALEALRKAIEAHGEPVIAGDNIPPKMRCVRLETWRNYWRNETTTEGSTERNAWARARQTLRDEGLVGNWGEWVWLIETRPTMGAPHSPSDEF